MKPEVTSDGKTVWVNTPSGVCIGRFSKTLAEADGISTGVAFANYRVGPTTAQDWVDFKESMWRNHLVIVGDQHMPEFLRVLEPA